MFQFKRSLLQSCRQCVLESRAAICSVPSEAMAICTVPSVAVRNLHRSRSGSVGVGSYLQRQGWTRFFSAKETVTSMVSFDAFDASMEDLIVKHGVKASKLRERLRDFTETASKGLPPLQVLYSNSVGGYAYSEAFKSFMEEKHVWPYSDDDWYLDREYRVRDVQWLAPFGQHVMERWPGIAKLVKAYMRNDLENRIRDVEKIVWSRNRLLQNRKKLYSFAMIQTGRIDGKTKSDVDEFGQIEDYSKVSPPALEALCTQLDAENTELTIAIHKKRDALLVHVTEAEYEAMLQSLRTKFAHEEGVDSERARETRRELSFIDAITHYGEYHYAVWQCQKHFNENAMRFLLLHPERIEGLASEGSNVDGTQKLGLCAAAEYGCDLQIEEVPHLAEWSMDALKGWEKVYLV